MRFLYHGISKCYLLWLNLHCKFKQFNTTWQCDKKLFFCMLTFSYNIWMHSIASLQSHDFKICLSSFKRMTYEQILCSWQFLNFQLHLIWHLVIQFMKIICSLTTECKPMDVLESFCYSSFFNNLKHLFIISKQIIGRACITLW